MTDLHRRATRGALWVAASSWSTRLLTVGVLAVLAVRLAPRDIGLLAVAALTSNILLVLNDLGFADAVIYDSEDVDAAAGTSALICISVSAVLGALLAVSSPWLARFFHVPDAAHIFAAYGVVVFVNGFNQTPRALLTRDLAFARRFVPEALPVIIGSALSIVLLIAGVGVWSVVIGDITRECISGVAAYAIVDRRPWPRWNASAAGRLWAFARGAMASSLADFALQNVDYVLIGRILGPVALGYYALAFRVAILPFLTIAFVIVGVAFPTFVRLREDRPAMRQSFETSFRVAMTGVTLVSAGMFALAPWLRILGAKWVPAVPLVRPLAIYVCLRSACQLVTPMVQAVGHPAVIAKLRVVWVLLLAGLIVSVGRHSIVTVAVVQAVVAAVLFVAHLVAARRFTGVAAARVVRILAPPVAAGAAAAAAVAGLHHGLGLGSSTSLFSFIWLGLVFTVCYAAIVLALDPRLLLDGRTIGGHLS